MRPGDNFYRYVNDDSISIPSTQTGVGACIYELSQRLRLQILDSPKVEYWANGGDFTHRVWIPTIDKRGYEPIKSKLAKNWSH
jgi:hypothetical protein